MTILKGVTDYDIPLDIRPHFSYKPQISLIRGTPFARVLLKAERERFLRAERHTPLPGGPGIVPAGMTTGEPGAWLKRDRRRG